MKRVLLAVAFVMAFSSSGYAQSIKNRAVLSVPGSFESFSHKDCNKTTGQCRHIYKRGAARFIFQQYRWVILNTSGLGGNVRIIKRGSADEKLALLTAQYVNLGTRNGCDNIGRISIHKKFRLTSLANISSSHKVDFHGILHKVDIEGNWAHIITIDCNDKEGQQETYYVACRDCSKKPGSWYIVYKSRKCKNGVCLR